VAASISGGFVLAGYIAYQNIKMSARLMLWLEFVSMGLILAIVGLVLSRQGLHMDTKQLSLDGVSLENVRMGLVMAIFSFVAFESSASLGVEADKPTISVPRAIMRSVLFSGVFFVVAAYALVLGFRNAHQNLAEATTPLLVITSNLGFADLGLLVNCCIMVSFFAAGLANLNAGARALYQMGQDKLIPTWLGETHAINQTPHNGVILAVAIALIIAVSLVAAGAPILDIVGWTGTLATFGFIYAYMATSAAAAKMLKTTGDLSFFKMMIVSASLAVLILALVGSLFPVPKFPYNILPIIFAFYMICGTTWCFGRIGRVGQKISAPPDIERSI
jgi:amino acid transporter